MLEIARRTGPEGLNHAVEALTAILPLPFEHEAQVSIVLGALVELGADPRRPAPAFAQLLARVFKATQAFIDACENAAEAEKAEEISVELRAAVSSRFPADAAASKALNPICLGSLAILSRCAESREIVRAQPRLELRAHALAPIFRAARLIWVLLSVLEDEELLVLDAAAQRGWRVRLSGVADNRQLHLLLAGALGGEHVRPSSAAIGAATNGVAPREPIQVQNAWTLFQWHALQSDGSLPTNRDAIDAASELVSCLGLPAQIESFEGIRTLLLGPALEDVTWNAGRLFHELHATLTVEETLSPAAVEGRLARMAASS
jgi:hypothetical protein